MIYGICGQKFHGKDTLAKHITQCNSKFVTRHFAAALKNMCQEIFNLSDAQVHDPAMKESKLVAPIYMDDFGNKMSEVTGLEIGPHRITATTPRELMQYFGTEYVRSVQDNYWISRTMQNVRDLSAVGCSVLLPDTRFLNEAKAIREAGGKIIRVTRGEPKPSADLHSSEMEMAAIEADHHVKVPEGNLFVSQEFAARLAAGDL